MVPPSRAGQLLVSGSTNPTQFKTQQQPVELHNSSYVPCSASKFKPALRFNTDVMPPRMNRPKQQTVRPVWITCSLLLVYEY